MDTEPAARIDAARVSLETAVTALLDEPYRAGQRLRKLCDRLLAWRAAHAEVLPDSEFADPEVQPRVRHLTSMQRAIISRLIVDARESGEVHAEVDANVAAELLLTQLRGLGTSGAPEGMADRATTTFDAWLAALVAGIPRSTTAPSEDRADAPPRVALAALDVRPILAGGDDPLDAILAALEGVTADGLLRLTAPFQPRPLIALLSQRGYSPSVWQDSDGAWQLAIRGPRAPELIDLRDLPAPEPLEEILVRSAALTAGRAMLARVPRVPTLLLPRLSERGLEFEVHPEADGTAILHLRMPA